MKKGFPKLPFPFLQLQGDMSDLEDDWFFGSCKTNNDFSLNHGKREKIMNRICNLILFLLLPVGFGAPAIGDTFWERTYGYDQYNWFSSVQQTTEGGVHPLAGIRRRWLYQHGVHH
jgi:hypothetical protein